MFLSRLSLLVFVALYSVLVAGRSCRAVHPKQISHSLPSSANSIVLPPKTHKHPKQKGAAATSAAAAAATAAQSAPASSQPASQVASSLPSTTSNNQPAQTSSSTGSGSTSPSEKFIGLGTRYGGSCTEEDCWQNGACSFVDYELPPGIDGSTCIPDPIWNKGANCGGCISVSYKGKTITVMVTNETGGNATHLDMTPATWAKLTNGYSGGGVDGIEWEWITCPIAESTPLWIKMHGGSSKYWFAATVENARERTGKLEVSSDQGASWKATVLNHPNMWILSGTLPSDTAWVRVTSVSGAEVIVKDVKLSSGVVTKADGNYA